MAAALECCFIQCYEWLPPFKASSRSSRLIIKPMSVFVGPSLPAGLPGMQTNFCVHTRSQ